MREVCAPEMLFRSQDVLVRRVGSAGGRVCVVTFDSFTDRPTLDRPGFAEAFLQSRGIDAVHVITRRNAWYQHPEVAAAMQAVRAWTDRYGRVLTYGSSMGAYAALRLAGLAGASVALAMTPQFSILPHRVPFEVRWSVQAARQADVWETALPLPDLPEAYVLFDPLNLDAQHAALLAAGMRTIPIRLRGAGHHVASFLQEIGLLQRVVLDACTGPLDVAGLEREARRLRRQSAQAWVALAHRAHRPAQRIALLRAALARSPANAAVMSQLGLALGAAGQVAEAMSLHRAALAAEPGQPQLLRQHATTLAATGDVDSALAVVAPLSADLEPEDHAALRASLSAFSNRPGRTTPVDPGARPPPGAAPVCTAAGQVGTVLFGPYLELRPGRYAVTFAVRPGAPPRYWWHENRVACVLDVAIHGGKTVLAARRLSSAALRASGGTTTLEFDLPSWTRCEFRVRATGAAALQVGPHRPVRPARPIS